LPRLGKSSTAVPPPEYAGCKRRLVDDPRDRPRIPRKSQLIHTWRMMRLRLHQCGPGSHVRKTRPIQVRYEEVGLSGLLLRLRCSTSCTAMVILILTGSQANMRTTTEFNPWHCSCSDETGASTAPWLPTNSAIFDVAWLPTAVCPGMQGGHHGQHAANNKGCFS
jgi:hypothetical protein